MSTNAKKWFLVATVVVPFLIYCIVYYAPIIRRAPFKAAEFVSFEYKWGNGDSLQNSYNSATGEYRYLTDKDSLVVKNIKLTKQDFNYLDSVADVQGFWNLPDVVANGEEDLKNPELVRFKMDFHYQKKSKEVIYLPSFSGNDKMKNAAATMQKTIENLLADSENK